MNQYYQILSSCRVPGPKQDSVVNFSKTKKPPMHITVVHNYQVGRCRCRGGGPGPEVCVPSTLATCPQEQACPGCPARPHPVPSAGPGTARAVTSGLPGLGGGCCQSGIPTSPPLSACLHPDSFLSWTCTTAMGRPSPRTRSSCSWRRSGTRRCKPIKSLWASSPPTIATPGPRHTTPSSKVWAVGACGSATPNSHCQCPRLRGQGVQHPGQRPSCGDRSGAHSRSWAAKFLNESSQLSRCCWPCFTDEETETRLG